MFQYTLIKDGVYLIVVYVGNEDTLPDDSFTASVTVEVSQYFYHFKTSSGLRLVVQVKSGSGYLSITDWPLLPFYGAMCAVYVGMGIVL